MKYKTKAMNWLQRTILQQGEGAKDVSSDSSPAEKGSTQVRNGETKET